MDFWDQYSIMFVVGLVLWPRMMGIYFGMIPAGSLSALAGWFFLPRMFLCGVLSATYGDSNGILLGVCWVIAIVVDLCSVVVKAIAGLQAAEHSL